MHSKKNHGYSIVETSMYGSYKIMQDHLYIFPRKFSDFQHMILKLYYCLDLTRLLCKISCASFQEKSFQYMFLKLSIVWILQDNVWSLVHLPRKILYLQAWSWNFTVVWILQDNARSLVHLSKKNLVFQFNARSWTLLLCGSYKIMQDLVYLSKKNLVFTSMILKLYCSVDLTR